MRLTRSFLLVAAVGSALLGAPAAEAKPVPPDEAERTLAQAEALLGDERNRLSTVSAAADVLPGRDATRVLLRLSASLDALGPAERRRAERLLARPGDGGRGDSFGKEAAASPVCNARVCVHWSRKAATAPPKADRDPANGIPDFVDEVGLAAARSYAVENEELGWRLPLPDGEAGARRGKGTGGQVDVYLDQLGSGLFGYATTDPRVKGRRKPGFLVLDNDYDGFKGAPVKLMQATMAHEYNHVVQFAYDLGSDAWMFESTATWMEERVYPALNEYIDFLDPTFQSPEAPLAEVDRWAFKLYGSALWNHYLTTLYGPEVIRAAWEARQSVTPDGFAAGAYERAIIDAGGSGFSQDFLGFAAATAEWRSTSVFPDAGLYDDVRRFTGIAQGQRGKLDHTGYIPFKVERPRGGDVVLEGRFEKGVRAGLALVGRVGPVIGGTVETEIVYLPNGGRGTVTLPDGNRFRRITAIVANADARLKGDSRRYRADGTRYRAKLG